jgi:hypothetical protein
MRIQGAWFRVRNFDVFALALNHAAAGGEALK